MRNLSVPWSSRAGNVDYDPQQAVDAQGGPTTQPGERETSAEEESRQQPQNTVIIAQHAGSSQFDMVSPSTAFGPQGLYNMAQLASALPPVSYGHEQYHQAVEQRYHPASPPPMLPQMPPVFQYTGPPPMSMAPQGYHVHRPYISSYYSAGQLSWSQEQSTMPLRPNIACYPNPMAITHSQAAYYYSQSTQYPAQAQNMPTPMAPGQYATGNSLISVPLASAQSPEVSGMPLSQSHRRDGLGRQKPTARGPRQNGHAVWIGNLPPQTDLMALVHHVSKETKGLESLFLIAKSNCAFANFKNQECCATAQQKLHESQFQFVRLVSRLRNSAVEAPTGPSVDTASILWPSTQTQGRPPAETSSWSSPPPVNATGHPTAFLSVEALPQQDRFFILKSLTVEDLELSVRTGIWATQSHNEEALNSAFKTCNGVYLAFSANKSGEYFGYARMASEINQDPDAAIIFTPMFQSMNVPELPKEIFTGATEHVPKGRIIDDSDRGTTFWEIEREDSESGSDDGNEDLNNKNKATVLAPEQEDGTWRKPFRVEWLSTSRLPFYQTRGLRNPWNSDREVKVARDGTEIEPSVGRRLIGLFTRMQSSRPPVATHPSMGMSRMMPGFPQVRPYGQ